MTAPADPSSLHSIWTGRLQARVRRFQPPNPGGPVGWNDTTAFALVPAASLLALRRPTAYALQDITASMCCGGLCAALLLGRSFFLLGVILGC